MGTDSKILTEVRRVVERATSLTEFEDWFVTTTWENDSPLIRRITGLLAESTSAKEGNTVVLEAFEQMLEQPTLTIPWPFVSPTSAPISFTTTSLTICRPPRGPAGEPPVAPIPGRSAATGSAQAPVVIKNMERWPNVTRQGEVRVSA